jgi:hypothetical protein
LVGHCSRFADSAGSPAAAGPGAGLSGGQSGPAGPGAESPMSNFLSILHLFLHVFEFLFPCHVSLSGVASFCLRFSGSEYSIEDCDFRIDDPDVAAEFEMKKRKLDETGGRPQHHASSRQTGKAAVDGSSSGAAGQPMKTKVVHPHGAHPSGKGKGVHCGPVDVEKEKEITENLGSPHINTWHRLRSEGEPVPLS